MPDRQSGSAIRFSTSSLTHSSGTSFPDFSRRSECFPRSSPASMCVRNMSPVEICGPLMQCFNNFAWVPFPEPGEPNRIMAGTGELRVFSLNRLDCAAAPAANTAGARREPFVMAHDELRLDLIDGVHCDPNHDQQRGASEIEVHTQAIKQPVREMRI